MGYPEEYNKGREEEQTKILNHIEEQKEKILDRVIEERNELIKEMRRLYTIGRITTDQALAMLNANKISLKQYIEIIKL